MHPPQLRHTLMTGISRDLMPRLTCRDAASHLPKGLLSSTAERHTICNASVTSTTERLLWKMKTSHGSVPPFRS
jgi:hypothetical protein